MTISPHLRPLQRLLARDIDLTRLPEADDMDELVVRIEALEQHIQFVQQSMSARIAALGHELSTAKARIGVLEPLAQIGSVTPALAHDLNTAVGNCSLSAYVMHDQLDEFRRRVATGALKRSELATLLDQLSEGVRIVGSASQCAAELVGSLKTVTIDSTSERERAFNLDTLISDVLVTLRPTLRQASVEVKVERAGEPGLTLHGQPGLLARVLLNLVHNTVAHAFAPGATEQPRRVTITVQDLPDGQVGITVGDNGCGMSAAVQARIFTPYFTTRADQGGSGLGLSQARELVEDRLGGRINVRSTQGEGSEFCLTLPRVAPSRPTHRAH